MVMIAQRPVRIVPNDADPATDNKLKETVCGRGRVGGASPKSSKIRALVRVQTRRGDRAHRPQKQDEVHRNARR